MAAHDYRPARQREAQNRARDERARAEAEAARRAGERQSSRTGVDGVTGAMAQFNRGLGFGDEFAAGFQTAINALTGRANLSDLPEDYRESLERQRAYERAFAGSHPRGAPLARGVGMATAWGFAPGGQVAAPTGAAPSVAFNALRMAPSMATGTYQYPVGMPGDRARLTGGRR